MRPNKLIVSAFGPYASCTTVEFDKLSTTGLYLITGYTGSGKTILFDAIVYALFGKASGGNREASMLRCKFAEQDTPTFVTLDFTHNSQKYTIIRNPEYVGKRKSGSKEIVIKASVELQLPSGKVITKVKDANGKIKEILGVDYHQFHQISMIAQGEFLKLLHATTEQRTDIFRNIFNTEKYNQLQQHLKEEVRNLKTQYNHIVEELNRTLQTADAQFIGENVYDFTLSINNLEDNLIADEKELHTLLPILEKTSNQLESVKQEITLAENRIELKNRHDELQKAFQLCEERLLPSKQALEKAKNNESDIDILTKRVVELNAQLGKYNELEELEKNEKELTTQISKTNELFKDKEQKKAAHQKDLITKTELLEILTAKESTLFQLAATAEKKQAEIEQLQALRNEAKQLVSMQTLWKETEETFTSTKNSYDDLAKELKVKQDLFWSGQAGILSQTLVDNEPCPVCGSLEHPAPTPLLENIPTKDAIDALESEKHSLQQQLDEKSMICGELKGKLVQLTKQVESATEKLIGEYECTNVIPALEEKLDMLAVELRKNEDEIAVLNNELAQIPTLKNEIPSLEKNIDILTKELSELSNDVLLLTSKLENVSDTTKKLVTTLPSPTKNVVEEEIVSSENRISEIRAEIRLAEETFQNNQTEIARLEGELSSLEKQLADFHEKDITKLLESRTILSNQKIKLEEEKTAIESRQKLNKSVLVNLKKGQDRLQNAEHRLNMMRSLSETANGNINGKQRIMLESYVQATIFDQVVAFANVRFLKMTSNQYELQRKKDSDNNRSQSGLELVVIDHYYDNTERGVRTLSGGESFMASLSLALGLSDVIQQSAGGFSFNAMFVDEGFGTLDEEALEKALRVLDELSHGNRLIGLISHVPELKHRISSQIQITKDKNLGSKVRIVNE